MTTRRFSPPPGFPAPNQPAQPKTAGRPPPPPVPALRIAGKSLQMQTARGPGAMPSRHLRAPLTGPRQPAIPAQPPLPRARSLTVQTMESPSLEQLLASLKQSVQGNFTKEDELDATVGSFTLHAEWGPNTTRPKDIRGKITCFGGSDADDGVMYFDAFAIGTAPTFSMMPKTLGIDASKLCAEVGYVESKSKKPGVGAACVYMLALVAERLKAPYMMVSSSIVTAFYVKLGFSTFSPSCDDMFGPTAKVKSQTQTHVK
jgi:hypothetical protein